MHQVHITLITICLTITNQIHSNTANNLKVQTETNIIIGYEYSDKINAFTGIPYAQAPIHDLRFESPKAFDNKNTSVVINNKVKETAICAQVTVLNGISEMLGVEDCLYLNVYTPKQKPDHRVQYPVMIYIHGGGFQWGTGTIFKPDYLLREENVILVTLNYRLGPFGFLTAGYPGDERIIANNGLKDQSMAIKWVHDNIGYFNGDNSRITLFGNSAGGASTHLHSFSPKSKGLFHSAILQSGFAFCHWALRPFKDSIKVTQEYVRLMDCPILPTIEMLDCMKTKSVEEMLSTITKFNVFNVDPMIIFSPTIEPENDDGFVTDSIENLIQKGDFNDVPLMFGTNANEGAIRAAYFVSTPDLYSKYNQHFNDLLRVTIFNDNLSTNQIKQIREFYFRQKPIDEHSLENFTSLITDSYFLCSERSMDFHRNHARSPIYSYFLNYKGALSFSSVFGKNETLDLGVCHMDELLYLFPLEFFFAEHKVKPKQLSKKDIKLMRIMTRIWVEFASKRHFDNLDIPEAGNLRNWKPVESENNEHLIIDQNLDFDMGINRYGKSRIFWENLISARDDKGKKLIKNEL